VKLKVGYSITLQAILFTRSNRVDLPGGETLQTQAPAAKLGETALEHTVAWTSSDEAVATVNASGTVVGIAAGSCTITAVYDSTTSETFPITVDATEDQKCVVISPVGAPTPKTNYTAGGYGSNVD